MQRIAKPA